MKIIIKPEWHKKANVKIVESVSAWEEYYSAGKDKPKPIVKIENRSLLKKIEEIEGGWAELIELEGVENGKRS